MSDPITVPAAPGNVNSVVLPVRLFFAIYYHRTFPPPTEESFMHAAQTWQQEATKEHRITSSDILIVTPVTKGDQFLSAWRAIHEVATSKRILVVEGALFTHASIKGRVDGLLPFFDDRLSQDGLEFRGEPGTVDKSFISKMEILPWDPQLGKLTLHGCWTGNKLRDGHWCPAEAFAIRQRIMTLGQAGYSHFSAKKMVYEKWDGDGTKPVYLWAYHHGKNVALLDSETGVRIPPAIFSP